MSKTIGIWIRVSTEDQAKGESPEHHEKRARMYAEVKGWEVYTTYDLRGVSGKSVTEHPEAKRMFQDVKAKKISGLIFSKLARLARDTKQLLEIADVFQKNNADLISLGEAIDTSTPAGRLFYTLNGAMAQWERESIAERVADSVPIRAQLGKPLGGAAPYGYAWENKKLVIDEKEAPIRKRMYELFKEYKRKNTVANILNKEGFRTRNGSEFSYTTVKRLLADPMAKGLRRANYTKSAGLNKKWDLKPKEDWVFHEAPAIVSEELWNEVNRILEEQEQNKKPAPRRPVHLFTGAAVCHCGGKMYVILETKKYTCQKCKNKIGEKDLEEIFQSQLNEFLLSDDQIKEFLSQTQNQVKEKEALLEASQKEAKTIQKKLDTLIELRQNNEIPREGFSKHYTPLFEQLQQIEKQTPELQGEIDVLIQQSLSSDQIFHEAKDLSAQWSNLSYDEKRMIVENITERIEIGKADITINLNYLPTLVPKSELTVGSHHNHRGSYSPPT
ncbi:MAG: recombinase family protein [Bacteroidia bacterium]